MKNRINNVLFDLDGTLINSKEGIINSVLFALKKLNITEINIKKLDSFLGPPLKESFTQKYKFSDSQAEIAITYYREYFASKGIYENVLFDGVDELLKTLFDHKYQLFVATSKPSFYADQIIRRFKLDKYFKDIIGSNLDNSHSDKTEIISDIISKHNLKKENCIMIGDRKHDIIGAKNNSIKSIGVTYGFGTNEELNLYKADFIANNCDEIKSIII